MKYYLIAGERSGDLHGGNLIQEIRKQDKNAIVRCWGGDAMQQAGGELVKHYRDLAFMGFWEVFKNLSTIRGFLRYCKADLADFQPDAVVLIDYAGFNLRIARFAKEQGWLVYYYIAPKTWAWNSSRTHKLRKYVDHVFSILPFEEDFFKKYGANVTYVGNPLLDEVRQFKPDPDFISRNGLNSGGPIIALLPGSRKQEIQNVLNILLSVVPKLNNVQFVVAAVDNLPSTYYDPVKNHPQVCVITGATYQILSQAQMAIVTSGTATLETALFNVPQVVVYKTSYVSYRIARALIKVPYISLVNLIMNKETVPELIQHDFTPQNVERIGKELLNETERRQRQLNDYSELLNILGNSDTSKTVAEHIITEIK